MCDSTFSILSINRHHLAVLWITPYRCIHCAFFLFKAVMDNAIILSCYWMDSKLCSNIIMCLVILTCNNNTCGIHIYSVYYSRTHNAINSWQIIPAMIHKCIDNCSCIMSCSRMYNHSLRFIYQYHIIIFIYYIQRYVFREYLWHNKFRNCYCDMFRSIKLIVGLDTFVINRNISII